ncbi:hypothetical protein, partial [Psychroserpens sp.]|uniref:hypothetical protein n=1 Tax=Psychroserpens sp. TaxID=2020870 RepID=UPI003C788BB1
YAKGIKLESAQDSIVFVRITAYIGYANNKYNNFFESISGFEEALKFIPSTKTKSVVNTNYATLFDLFARYYSLRRYKKALTIALQAEALLNEYDFSTSSQYIALYQRKFRMYLALGFYDKAAIEVEKIKQKLLSINSESEVAKRSSWMRYHRTNLLLNYKRALFYKQKKNKFNDKIVPLTQNIVEHMNHLDSIVDHTKALQNPKTNRELWDLSLYVGALYYVSDFYKVLKDYDRSLNYINKAISLSKKSNEPARNVSEFLRFKANVFDLSGDMEGSLTLLNQLEQDYNQDSYYLNEVLTFKGDLYLRGKEKDSVLKYYTRSLRSMHDSDEKLKSDFSNYASRFQFPSDCEQIQHMSTMLHKTFPTDSLAFEKARHLNAIAYNEFLTNHNNLDLSRGNKELYYKIIEAKLEFSHNVFNDEHQFISNLENISNRLAWQKFKQSRDIVALPLIDSLENVEYQIRKQLVAAKKQRQQKRKDSLERVLFRYQRQIKIAYPKISEFTQDNFEISNFQNKLRDDEVALKYIFFDEQFAVFQITKSDISWELKPWKDTEQELLDEHISFLKNPNRVKDEDERLTKALMPKSALEFKKIIIVPDIPIYYLPFETLNFNNGYLVNEKSIRYSSHLR